MKLYLRLFCCFALLAAMAGCGLSMAGNNKVSGKKAYLGTWKGTDFLGQTMVLTLKEDGHLDLNVSAGKRSFTKRGTYKIDTSCDPAHFDIDLSDRGQIETIMKLIDNDRLAFENIGSSNSRPSQFGEGKMIFKRQ